MYSVLLMFSVTAYGATLPAPQLGLSGGLVYFEHKVTASDGAEDDEFGWSVALDGDTALVGARYNDVSGRASQGAVYVFVRSGPTWSLQQKLTASDGAAGDHFGWSVAVDGDTVYLVTESCTQLGGHAVTWAGDPAENAYLARSDFGPLVGQAVESLAWLDRTGEHLRRDLERAQGAGRAVRPLERSLAALERYRQNFEHHRRGVAEWRLLFILASDEELGMNWGDMGMLSNHGVGPPAWTGWGGPAPWLEGPRRLARHREHAEWTT